MLTDTATTSDMSSAFTEGTLSPFHIWLLIAIPLFAPTIMMCLVLFNVNQRLKNVINLWMQRRNRILEIKQDLKHKYPLSFDGANPTNKNMVRLQRQEQKWLQRETRFQEAQNNHILREQQRIQERKQRKQRKETQNRDRLETRYRKRYYRHCKRYGILED